MKEKFIAEVLNTPKGKKRLRESMMASYSQISKNVKLPSTVRTMAREQLYMARCVDANKILDPEEA